jgi:hypothetical protein
MQGSSMYRLDKAAAVTVTTSDGIACQLKKTSAIA